MAHSVIITDSFEVISLSCSHCPFKALGSADEKLWRV